jgi:kynurenine 3-monooxygenase
MTTERPVFTVIGAGLAGPLMAAYLGRAGYEVDLYERRADPRAAGAQGGRSINLALSDRGLYALEEVGALDAVRPLLTPMRGRMMHAVSGKLTFQPYGTGKDQVLHSVSRSGLNELLLDVAESSPSVRVHFEHKCLEVDPEAGHADFEVGETGASRTVETGIVIGADGAFSRVRAALARYDRFDYRQDYLEHGYKELILPARPGGGYAMEPGALHIWPRGSFMLIALPNLDESFTCTLFWPFEGSPSFATIREPGEIRSFFEATFPDVVPLLPGLVEEYRGNPTGSLVTVRCHPWHRGGTAVLVGDACHAVVPFYGQGMNAAFEDCTVLAASLAEHGPDWERAFGVYEARRKVHTDALADLAIENFLEMRDRTGSGAFLLRKKTERFLHRAFPSWYVPLYSMITFSRIPYAEAVRRARRQDRVVGTVASVLLLFLLLFVLALNGGS